MNLLKSIIERLNQRVEVANIFDQLYPLCELNANGNEKAWVHYIGNGQAEVVTNFDAKQGTLFWAKRGKVSVVKTESFKVSGCKTLYQTTFPLTAYAVVRKSHLPCDSEDSQDWIASRIYRLISGTDPDFKSALAVIQYEVIPNGYVNEIKSLTANYEWACVAIDVDVAVVSASEDGCYDICATGDIPLPDFEPCTPCLTEVAVDGVTITGNGTTADPLVAIGGEGSSILLQTDDVNNGSQTILNLKEGTNITITDDGVGGITIDASGDLGVTNVTATLPLSSTEGTTPDISITQADGTTDGYLSSADWNTFDGKFNVPTGLSTDYLDGTGSPVAFPTLPTGTVTSVDLSMPAAFSVTGNPVTTSGTLAVTAAGVATQYIRGDGQLANFPTSSGGGSAVSFYLNGSVNQGTLDGVAFKQMSNTPVIGAGTDFSINADGYIQSFITDATVPNQLLIPAGNWNFEMYFSANNAGSSPRFYIDIFKLSAGTLSLIASSSANPEFITNGAVIDLYTTAVAMPSTVLLTADRIAIRVYVIHSSKTITLHTEDSHLCQVLTTFATGLTSLNGLTEQTQLLAVGTSGTDFGISSATATHTFNLPTASAANRGALSSSDFTTFAAKQDALVSGTNIKTINSTSILGAGNISILVPTIYKSATDGAAIFGSVNTLSQSFLVPANTITTGNVLEFTIRGRKTIANNIFTIRLYSNTTNNLLGTPILLATFTGSIIITSTIQMTRTAVVKNATTNTEMVVGVTSLATDNINSAFTSNLINWTVDQYIIGAVQNNSNFDSSLISLMLMKIL